MSRFPVEVYLCPKRACGWTYENRLSVAGLALVELALSSHLEAHFMWRRVMRWRAWRLRRRMDGR